MLFRNKKRIGIVHKTNYKLPLESFYDFRDRSTLDFIKKERSFLNKWFMEFPEEERKDLESRIKSKKEDAVSGAIFEIILFAYFKELGCEIKTHPELPDTSKSPDFLIRTPNGEEFYLEATNTYDSISEEKKLKEQRDHKRKEIEQCLYEIENTDFHFSIDVKKKPLNNLKKSLFKNKIKNWLKTLNPEIIDEDGREKTFHLESDGLVEIRASFRGEESRKEDKVSISSSMFSFWGVGVGSVVKGIKSKSKRYGELDLPYYIAINSNHISLNYKDGAESALRNENIFEKNVNGIFIFNGLSIEDFLNKDFCLFQNEKEDAIGFLLKYNYCIFNRNNFKYCKNKKSLSEISKEFNVL
jgi:hypothetical protein